MYTELTAPFNRWVRTRKYQRITKYRPVYIAVSDAVRQKSYGCEGIPANRISDASTASYRFPKTGRYKGRFREIWSGAKALLNPRTSKDRLWLRVHKHRKGSRSVSSGCAKCCSKKQLCSCPLRLDRWKAPDGERYASAGRICWLRWCGHRAAD